MQSFSPKNRIKMIILVGIGMLSAIGAIVAGVDDIPPGILLALLAAIAIVLAFVHSWREARKFLFLFLAAMSAFILFVILSITIDTTVQDPTSPAIFGQLAQSPIFDILSIVIIMVCTAAFFIGAIGWIIMFICNRHKVSKT